MKQFMLPGFFILVFVNKLYKEYEKAENIIDGLIDDTQKGIEDD